MLYPHAYVLTGGIASGKSTVANLLKLYGFSIISADTIAHQLLNNNAQKIVALFGEQYLENNRINRPKLAERIFNDTLSRHQLEEFLHPLIYKVIIENATLCETKNHPYFIEIPLFFEVNNYPFVRTVVVYTPQEIQLQRLIEREQLTKDQALSRLNAQLPIDEKKERAFYVIDNSQNLAHLQDELTTFLHHEMIYP